jgi:4-hydroxy-2-oxoheptanedioate aldolase
VGPSDFSIAWTNGATINPTLEDMMPAVAHIGQRVRAAGKFAAIYLMDMGYARRYVELGFQMLATGSEGQLVARGSGVVLAEVNASLKG